MGYFRSDQFLCFNCRPLWVVWWDLECSLSFQSRAGVIPLSTVSTLPAMCCLPVNCLGACLVIRPDVKASQCLCFSRFIHLFQENWDLPSVVSLSRCPQWPVLGHPQAGQGWSQKPVAWNSMCTAGTQVLGPPSAVFSGMLAKMWSSQELLVLLFFFQIYFLLNFRVTE